MPSVRVRGLALKKTKLGETDLIVTFLAADGSQVRAVARGARKPGSRLAGRIEPLSVVDLLLHPGRSLFTITEAELVHAHAGIRTDLERSLAASVVADFLDKISVEEQAEERLFGLAVATLGVMETADEDGLLALVTAFLLKGIAMHGYRPQFSTCIQCGAPASGEGCYSIEHGGPVCASCERTVERCWQLPNPAEASLRALIAARMTEVPRLGIDRRTLRDAFGFVRAYVVHHIPARLKALGMYSAGLHD